jgi:membrane-associated phospholipid phosphatase
MQEAASPLKKNLWRIWSEIALYGCIFLPILVSLVGKRDLPLSTYYSFILTVLAFFSSFLKMFYHDPRPFWSSDDVQAFNCSTQYGNPSGHSMLTFGISVAYALEYNEKNVE